VTAGAETLIIGPVLVCHRGKLRVSVTDLGMRVQGLGVAAIHEMRQTTRSDSCVETVVHLRSQAGHPSERRAFGELLSMICKLSIGVAMRRLPAKWHAAAAAPAEASAAIPGVPAVSPDYVIVTKPAPDAVRAIGGPTNCAADNRAHIACRAENEKIRRAVKLKAFVDNGAMRQNLQLHPGLLPAAPASGFCLIGEAC
jgi:hypothetical protein